MPFNVWDPFLVSLKVQQAQLLQQQQQQQALRAQQQFAYQQSADNNVNQAEASSFGQADPQSIKYQQSPANRFSPSNEVSHVKFSSGDSSYNF